MTGQEYNMGGSVEAQLSQANVVILNLNKQLNEYESKLKAIEKELAMHKECEGDERQNYAYLESKLSRPGEHSLAESADNRMAELEAAERQRDALLKEQVAWKQFTNEAEKSIEKAEKDRDDAQRSNASMSQEAYIKGLEEAQRVVEQLAAYYVGNTKTDGTRDSVVYEQDIGCERAGLMLKMLIGIKRIEFQPSLPPE